MFFYVFLLLFHTIEFAKGCKYSTNRGTFDLSPLSGKSWYVYDSWTLKSYQFSFCDNLADSSGCTQTPISGSCAIQIGYYGVCYNMGSWGKSYKLSSTSDGFGIEFDNGASDECPLNKPRSVTFTFQCSEGTEMGTMTITEDITCQYTVIVPTEYVCDSYIIPLSSKDELSGGSIFLIIFFVLIILYFVGGFSFNKYHRGLEGRDAVPQVNFWTTLLPFWIKTGCMVSWAFTVDVFWRIRANITGLPQHVRRTETDDDGKYAEME